MIGPGTGLAPFRGFIQERDFTSKDGKTVGDTILYFGCRKKSEDYLYEEVRKDFNDESEFLTFKIISGTRGLCKGWKCQTQACILA